MLKPGAVLNSEGSPLRQRLPAIARQGIQGVVLDAVDALSPEKLSETGRREVGHLVSTNELQLIGLRCPLRRGLVEVEGLEARLERLTNAMQLSFELGARTIFLAPGPVPEKEEETQPEAEVVTSSFLLIPSKSKSSPRDLFTAAMRDLLQRADRIGCRVLVEAGSEPVPLLMEFLSPWDAELVGISFDPAHFVMQGEDIFPAIRQVASRLQHLYARDGLRQRLDRSGKETDLGAGDIDWLQLAGVLEEVHYRGWLSIKRNQADVVSSLSASLRFLRQVGLVRPTSDDV